MKLFTRRPERWHLYLMVIAHWTWCTIVLWHPAVAFHQTAFLPSIYITNSTTGLSVFSVLLLWRVRATRSHVLYFGDLFLFSITKLNFYSGKCYIGLILEKKKKSVGFTCDQYTGFDDFEPWFDILELITYWGQGKSSTKPSFWDFPGGPVVKTPCFHSRLPLVWFLVR